ncbi:hypothetical protein LPW11_06035 [Geomonas sp. RF6]|uniref:hypothetical protein n=1 Tax=Geomonas sp. RF6 TaxID=2897342 RepID=UPI001E39CFF3|nr:hypothetical protein [Geomonas sp. RF6]UFS71750.1 hypothetical protein LPW11_06035 [Geomonas sp. RF6]
MHKLFSTVVLLIGMCLVGSAGVAGGEKGHGNADETVTRLHHMHTLMNHSLIMALQGSDLLMHSRMQPPQPLGQLSAAHGKEMIAQGKATLKDVLSGTEMKMAHEQGRWSDPLMGYTHELGAELLALVDDLEKVELRELSAHQRQIPLNHALEMAAEGSNLVMLGGMKMAGPIDERTVRHGRKMIADGRKLWDQAAAAMSQQSPAERSFIRHGGKVISLLEKMSALQE